MNEIQRLILANQYLILSKLDKENQKYYERQIKVLKQGYEREVNNLLKERVNDFFPEDRCSFVRDVLEMYNDIILSFEELKLKLDVNLIKFPGFDENGESGHRNYAEFILEGEDGFDYVKKHCNKDCNSHRPMIKEYERKLEVYKGIKSKKAPTFQTLGENEIKKILNTH